MELEKQDRDRQMVFDSFVYDRRMQSFICRLATTARGKESVCVEGFVRLSRCFQNSGARVLCGLDEVVIGHFDLEFVTFATITFVGWLLLYFWRVSSHLCAGGRDVPVINVPFYCMASARVYWSSGVWPGLAECKSIFSSSTGGVIKSEMAVFLRRKERRLVL